MFTQGIQRTLLKNYVNKKPNPLKTKLTVAYNFQCWGARAAQVVRALAFQQGDQGSNPGVVKFVAGSLFCSKRFFLRVLRFSPLLKNQHFQIPIRSGTHGFVSKSSPNAF